MNGPRQVAVRAGLGRGWIELRQVLTSPVELLNWLWLPIVALVVMFFLRGNTVPGTEFSLGSQAVPGILGVTIVFTGLLGLAVGLTTEREDGTLLRARATPNGVLGYLVGKVAGQSGMTLVSLVLVLVPAALLFDGLAPSWPRLLGVVLLGLLATLPLGAMLGAVFRNVQSLGLLSMLIMGLVSISGVFYPIGSFPIWLQWVAQAFPLYWLGLGLRAALLPAGVAAAEVGGSWRPWETVAALGVWAVFGLVVAPMVLRRTARRPPGRRSAEVWAP